MVRAGPAPSSRSSRSGLGDLLGDLLVRQRPAGWDATRCGWPPRSRCRPATARPRPAGRSVCSPNGVWLIQNVATGRKPGYLAATSQDDRRRRCPAPGIARGVEPEVAGVPVVEGQHDGRLAGRHPDVPGGELPGADRHVALLGELLQLPARAGRGAVDGGAPLLDDPVVHQHRDQAELVGLDLLGELRGGDHSRRLPCLGRPLAARPGRGALGGGSLRRGSRGRAGTRARGPPGSRPRRSR